jgi:histidyl-tRNA synthetase
LRTIYSGAGTVFEAFDRKNELRAICGGGRYDRLLGTFGCENVPMVGFGVGDAVIMELLAIKGLVPEKGHAVDDVVVCMDEDLRHAACAAASQYGALALHCSGDLDARISHILRLLVF